MRNPSREVLNERRRIALLVKEFVIELPSYKNQRDHSDLLLLIAKLFTDIGEYDEPRRTLSR